MRVTDYATDSRLRRALRMDGVAIRYPIRASRQKLKQRQSCHSAAVLCVSTNTSPKISISGSYLCAVVEVGIPGKCSKIKCFWTSQRRQASRGKGSKNVRCSLRIWRQIGSLERKLERKEREQRATHTRLVLVKQMR